MRLRFARAAPDELRTLHPAYFALVMATGIVAIGAALHGRPALGRALLWLNLAFYISLVALTAWRALRYRREFMDDLSSHSRGVGFFTAVAATGVLGTELVVQIGALGSAGALWLVTLALWLLVTYGVLALLTVKEKKPTLEQGLNGGWLVSVVATQSVSILTVLLVAHRAARGLESELVFAALGFWLAGGALYLWLTTLIFFRCLFGRIAPADLAAPYWINMGAVAISTLAGATLLEHLQLVPALGDLASFIKGATLLFWATGTWWIPLLVVLALWRYLLRGFPFQYDPLTWGGVFPLGMYCVCTYHLSRALQLPFLLPLSELFFYIAAAAWLVAFAGLLDSLGQRRARV